MSIFLHGIAPRTWLLALVVGVIYEWTRVVVVCGSLDNATCLTKSLILPSGLNPDKCCHVGRSLPGCCSMVVIRQMQSATEF